MIPGWRQISGKFFSAHIFSSPPCLCLFDPLAALKSSPSKKGRVSLTVPKCGGPGAAWSASQLPSERDENIYDLRGARSFPTLEDEGEFKHRRVELRICQSRWSCLKAAPNVTTKEEIAEIPFIVEKEVQPVESLHCISNSVACRYQNPTVG